MKPSVSAWLEASEEDLSVVKALLQSKLATGAASFHAQQCVEKSLKALLEEHTKNDKDADEIIDEIYQSRSRNCHKIETWVK
ncbi:MAG: HEPN domain-containing protein [Desulfamplus sp.]|nr:HEPN domain-containing protein [Desulfamplus sp.]